MMKNSTTNIKKPTKTTSRAGVAVGLTAGLLGGAAAGLVLGVPGLSSAAGGDQAAETPAALVQQVDEPTDTPAPDDADTPAPDDADAPAPDDADTPAPDDADTPAPGDADAPAPDRADAPAPDGADGDRHSRRGRHHERRAERSDAIAELLGIDVELLREQLQSGETLAAIAEANGVDTATLVDTLLADAEERVAAAVEAGRLTAEEAAERTADLDERITERVSTVHERRSGHGDRPARLDRATESPAEPDTDAEG